MNAILVFSSFLERRSWKDAGGPWVKSPRRRGVSWLIAAGLGRLEWNETTPGRSFYSKLFLVSILNCRQLSNQTEQKVSQLTFTVAPRSSTLKKGTANEAASALDTENDFEFKYAGREYNLKASLKAAGASHPSRALENILKVVILPLRLNHDY